MHGSNINQTYWDAQVNYFSPKYQVITLDLAGHGQSGQQRDEWSIDGLAEDVVAVIKELELINIILIGHSMGADICLIAATRYPAPIKGFICVDNLKNAATPLPPEYDDQVADIMHGLRTDYANTMEQYVRKLLVGSQTSEAVVNRVISNYRHSNQALNIPVTEQIFNDVYRIEEELLPHLPVKLYLLNVNNMPTNEAPLKKHAAKGYELVSINGTSHYPMIENPNEFNEALNQIIQKILNDVN